VYSSEEFSTEDAFILEKVESGLTQSILYFRSALPELKNFALLIKNGDTKNLKSSLFSRMEHILKQVCHFLFGKKVFADVDIKTLSGQLIQTHQKILKEMKLIDILFDILYFTFKNKLLDPLKMNVADPLVNLLSNVYTCIRYTIAEFRPNELYASQWLSLIMDQSLNSRDNNDIQAGRTLQELIDNNKRILDSRITKDIINQFLLFMIREEKNSNTVNILRAICICDGTPMLKNQKELSKLLLDDNYTRESLLFKIRYQYNRLEINPLDANYRWLSITEFKKRSVEIENGSRYKYFVSMVNLLADLCMSRNYIAINPLKDYYKMSDCFEIVADPSFSFDLREAFCKLLINLWVDVSPFELLRLPNYAVELTGRPEDIRISTSDYDPSEYRPIKKFCVEHLKVGFTSKGITSLENDEQNQFSLSILQLTQ
jgi:hypothetical protein